METGRLVVERRIPGLIFWFLIVIVQYATYRKRKRISFASIRPFFRELERLLLIMDGEKNMS
jgi:hypothetical protein